MPYAPAHKEKTRARIVECARILFNRLGFDGVTIDMVMEQASLTRGGFYNHFKSKEELFAAAVSSFLMGRGARWLRARGGLGGSEGAAGVRRCRSCSQTTQQTFGSSWRDVGPAWCAGASRT